jgi:7-cyano-7-deazaguanine reductase
MIGVSARGSRVLVIHRTIGTAMADYTADHARAGIQTKLPKLDSWPNQFPCYVITTRFPEYTSVCPKTGLPDYGTITIRYMPRKECLELKALKMYLLAYRDLGIFYENAVNKILHDIVEAVHPVWCVVRGEFTPRGGLTTSIFARWPGRARVRQGASKARARRSIARQPRP